MELNDFLNQYCESANTVRKRALKKLKFTEKFELRIQVREKLKASSGTQKRLLQRIFQELNRELFGIRSMTEFQTTSKHTASKTINKLTPSTFQQAIQDALKENQEV